MPTIRQGIAQTSQLNKEFVGTVAFRNEKLTLPDGSKVAIGIDGDRWVIVFQEVPKTPFIVYEYNATKNTLMVDKKPGQAHELEKVMMIVNYFFEHADCDDVVTIEAKVVEAL
jgi:hypothetical protein